MNKKKFTKLLALYLPYLVIGLAATNLGEAWRLAEGKELGDKIMSLMLHWWNVCMGRSSISALPAPSISTRWTSMPTTPRKIIRWL